VWYTGKAEVTSHIPFRTQQKVLTNTFELNNVKDDLNFWLKTLENYKTTRLCPISKPVEIQWVGDASTSFGIGVLVGHRWAQLQLKENWQYAEPKRTIAWLETVAIRVGVLVVHEILKDTKGNNFIVYTDNTTTESVLKSRKSRDHHSNQELKQIQQLLVELELDITPIRVISKENKADGLSRGVCAPHVTENRVWFLIPDDLTEFLFHA
jgi:hypothetical protein